MAYRADSIWSTPQNFGATINTPGFEGMPCLSSDNRELYFASNREGGFGGLDIWSSRFEHGLWQPPRNLGVSVNTPGDETAPFIYADNSTLFFASTGRAGMGGSDLFTTRRLDDTSWEQAVNLGVPINSSFDEVSLSLNAAGDTAYFASDRDSVAGNYDIYQAPLPKAFSPAQVMYLKGIVYDSVGQGSLNYASIYITDSATQKDLYHVQSNRGDGSYTIALPVGRGYAFYVDRIGFQSINDTLSFDTSYVGKTITYNIPLLPHDYQKPTTDTLATTLYFVKNSTDLSPADKIRIEEMLAPWKGTVGLTILVNGYTDNTGTPLLNEQLSYTRARLVSSLIQAMGFDPEIVQPTGWGEANPLAENDTDEHRDMNRRVEIIVRQ
jgi:outer membrane protein OmpA-like peptidoglycan-associated protein